MNVKPVLLCVYYHNRSKKGNLELLTKWSIENDIHILLIANRVESYVHALMSDIYLLDFSSCYDVQAWCKIKSYIDRNQYNVKGIIPFGEDEVPICTQLAAYFSSISNNHQVSITTREKFHMREMLNGTEIYIPNCHKVGSLKEAERAFSQFYESPDKCAFIKPPLGTGSMHCQKIENMEQLRLAWNDLFFGSWEFAKRDPLSDFLFQSSIDHYYLILEDLLGTFIMPNEDILRPFFQIHEFSVEGFVHKKRLNVYGITDKLIPHDKDGREYMWRTTKLPKELCDIIILKAKEIVRIFGIDYGCTHFEFRIETVSHAEADYILDNIPVRLAFLEGASRFGGAYMQNFWLYATGYNAIHALADQACGILPAEYNLNQIHPTIMLNLWPESSGCLQSYDDILSFKDNANEYLLDFCMYENIGERVNSNKDAERGVGHVILQEKAYYSLADTKEEKRQKFFKIESLFMDALSKRICVNEE